MFDGILTLAATTRTSWVRPLARSPETAARATLVSGTTLALTMAMAGRRAYCDARQGDGAATLRERCGPRR
jgi:hypothetical protein